MRSLWGPDQVLGTRSAHGRERYLDLGVIIKLQLERGAVHLSSSIFSFSSGGADLFLLVLLLSHVILQPCGR